MKNRKTFISKSKTTQSSSLVTLSEPGKDLSINKGETEDNIDLLLSVFDSLNKLHEKLNRLNYEIQKKSLEQILHSKGKGVTK